MGTVCPTKEELQRRGFVFFDYAHALRTKDEPLVTKTHPLNWATEEETEKFGESIMDMIHGEIVEQGLIEREELAL